MTKKKNTLYVLKFGKGLESLARMSVRGFCMLNNHFKSTSLRQFFVY